MKTTLLFIMLSLVITTSCSKTSETDKLPDNSQTNTEFHIYVNFPDSVILGDAGTGYFTITSLNNKSSDFKLFLKLSDDKVSLVIGGKSYRNGEIISGLKEGKYEFLFQNLTIGNLALEFKIVDEFKNTVTISRPIKIVPSDFKITLGTENPNIDISQNGSIVLNISSEKSVPNYQYELKFTGSGTISYNGKQYTQGQILTFSQTGTYNIGYKPAASGKYNIDFIITDFYKRAKTTTTAFNVYNGEFEVSGLVGGADPLPGASKDAGFSINTFGVTGIKYEAKIIGDGSIVYNGRNYSSGQYFALEPNSVNSYGFVFVPTTSTVGSVPLTVVVKNQFGTEKTLSLQITYKNGSFKVTITTESSYTLTESIFVFLTIEPNPIPFTKDLTARFSLKQGVIETVNGIPASGAIPLEYGYSKIYLKLNVPLSKRVIDELTVTVTKPNYETITTTKSIDLTK